MERLVAWYRVSSSYFHLAEHRGPPAITAAIDAPEPARPQPSV